MQKSVKEPKPQKKRDPNDFYPTDPLVVQAAVRRLASIGFSVVIDVGAGTGVWGEVIKKHISCKLIGVEVRREAPPNPVYDQWITDDFMHVDLPFADLVIGNPPFKFAQEMLLRGWQLVERRVGVVYFLLPLNFLGSIRRKKYIYDVFKPQNVYVLSNRPSYSGDGKTANRTEYAFYKWDFGKPRTAPVLEFIDHEVEAEQIKARMERRAEQLRLV